MEESCNMSNIQKDLDSVKFSMENSGQKQGDIEDALKLLEKYPQLAAQTAKDFEKMQETQSNTHETVTLSEVQRLYNENNQLLKGVKSPWTYRKLRKSMKEQYEQFINLINGREKEGWVKVDPGEDYEHSLWEKENDEDDNVYILKASCLMNVDHLRVKTLMTNTDFKKRMRWDPNNLCQVNKTAEDGSIEIIPGIRLLRSVTRSPKKHPTDVEVPLHQKFSIVESYIKPPTMFGGIQIPLVAIRRYLTSQWVLHNKKQKEWVILTHSLEDPRYPLFDGMVDATGFGGVRISYDDDKTCVVTIIAHINPGGYIPASVVKWGKDKLVTLLKQIKAGCKDDLYNDVYGK